ncbi:MAG: pyridoxal-phosphate dependent enzyme, partial [Chloroflexota bacterium]
APVITLGEGNTPLVTKKVLGSDVGFKLEGLNPTGSFKDRLTAIEISFLQSLGITQAVEDSSGNAGASFAAYAASAGIDGTVYVPDYASGPKRHQIEAYGQEIIMVPGPRSAAGLAVMEAVAKGANYASHAYLPIGTPGYATIAYELVAQMGQAPGTVISPVGHGSLLQGIILGFEALMKRKIIQNMPHFVGMQARACAPLWLRKTMGEAALEELEEGETLAEGVRVMHPIRGDALIKLSEKYSVDILAVTEENIMLGKRTLAKMGMYVEPTSAIVWEGILFANENTPPPSVAILTGSGLKSLK